MDKNDWAVGIQRRRLYDEAAPDVAREAPRLAAVVSSFPKGFDRRSHGTQVGQESREKVANRTKGRFTAFHLVPTKDAQSIVHMRLLDLAKGHVFPFYLEVTQLGRLYILFVRKQIGQGNGHAFPRHPQGFFGRPEGR
eukprot:scaffold24048_cov194-Amphora_coffeaeformis.AAC.28